MSKNFKIKQQRIHLHAGPHKVTDPQDITRHEAGSSPAFQLAQSCWFELLLESVPSFTPSARVLALNRSHLPIALASSLVCLGLSSPSPPINHPAIKIIFPENISNYILLFRYSLLNYPLLNGIKSNPLGWHSRPFTVWPLSDCLHHTFFRPVVPGYSHALCYPHTCLLWNFGRSCFLLAENTPQSSLPITISQSLKDQLKG